MIPRISTFLKRLPKGRGEGVGERRRREPKSRTNPLINLVSVFKRQKRWKVPRKERNEEKKKKKKKGGEEEGGKGRGHLPASCS